MAGMLKKIMDSVPNPVSGEGNIGQELKEKAQNVRAAKESMTPSGSAGYSPARMLVPSSADRMHPTMKYGDKPGEKRIDVKDMIKPLGVMHSGGMIPKTGAYIMKEGEHVMTPEKHGMLKHAMSLAETALSHPEMDQEEPKKMVKEMRIRKASDGSHVIEHHHMNPSMHPMEEHTAKSMSDLHKHMDSHWGPEDDGGKGEIEKDLGFKMAKPASYADGGEVQEGGLAMVHRGETVLPATNRLSKLDSSGDIYIGGEPPKPAPKPVSKPAPQKPTVQQDRKTIQNLRKTKIEPRGEAAI